MSPLRLALPMTGRMLVQNSPADRVPSHGTDRFGLRYAIDLVPVDERGRSAPRGLRSWLTTEPPERFVGFGRPVLAPVGGSVVVAHDGEPDGVARRVRAGVTAIAGNHVVLSLDGGAGFCWIVHLRQGSVRPAVGERVDFGSVLGQCGSSGNSTEPHVHVHLSSSLDGDRAAGGADRADRVPGCRDRGGDAARPAAQRRRRRTRLSGARPPRGYDHGVAHQAHTLIIS